MLNLPNIFVSGQAGSGKSYICKYLTDYYNYKTYKMAEPVYNLAYFCGMKDKDRALLQTLGTEIGRKQINQDIWINRFVENTQILQKYYEFIGQQINFTSDDIRFANEKTALLNAGWKGIYLHVSDDIRRLRLIKRDGTAQDETLHHVSETEMLTFKDELIPLDASGTLDETYNNLENILQQFKHSERVI